MVWSGPVHRAVIKQPGYQIQILGHLRGTSDESRTKASRTQSVHERNTMIKKGSGYNSDLILLTVPLQDYNHQYTRKPDKPALMKDSEHFGTTLPPRFATTASVSDPGYNIGLWITGTARNENLPRIRLKKGQQPARSTDNGCESYQ